MVSGFEIPALLPLLSAWLLGQIIALVIGQHPMHIDIRGILLHNQQFQLCLSFGLVADCLDSGFMVKSGCLTFCNQTEKENILWKSIRL